MESGGISRVIDFLAKRPELDQCSANTTTFNITILNIRRFSQFIFIAFNRSFLSIYNLSLYKFLRT